MIRKFYPIKKKEVKELEGSTLKKVMYHIQQFKDEHCSVHFHLNDEEVASFQMHEGHRNVIPCTNNEVEMPSRFIDGTTTFIDFRDFHYIVKEIKYGMGVCCFTNGRGENIENSMLAYELYIERDETLSEDPDESYIVSVKTEMDLLWADELCNPRVRCLADFEEYARILYILNNSLDFAKRYVTIYRPGDESGLSTRDEINSFNKLHDRGYFPGHVLSIYGNEIQKVLTNDGKKTRIGYLIKGNARFNVYEHLEDAIKNLNFFSRIF